MIIVAGLSALSLLIPVSDPGQDQQPPELDPPALLQDQPAPEQESPAPPQDQPSSAPDPSALQDQPAPVEDHPAAKAYFACLVDAAQRYDDGHSDAATIALGIESICDDQFQAFKAETTDGLHPDAREMAFDKIDQMQERYAIKAVLTVRSLRAQARSQN